MPTLTEIATLDAGTTHRCDVCATVTFNLVTETSSATESTWQLCETCAATCAVLRSDSPRIAACVEHVGRRPDVFG